MKDFLPPNLSNPEWITIATLGTVTGSVMILLLIRNVLEHVFGFKFKRWQLLLIAVILSLLAHFTISDNNENFALFYKNIVTMSLVLVNALLIYALAHRIPIGTNTSKEKEKEN